MDHDLIASVRFDETRGKRVLAALSGGADSVALLILLYENQARYGFSLAAAHLNHGIRGAQADEDAAFCRTLCKKLGVALIEDRIDVPALARRRSQGLESVAREARYGFLRDAQKRCGADLIALAHHQDDQAETILMHLFRGAGPDGACGMARLSDGLYRPLLEIPKRSLMQFLEKRGVSWREDATNVLPDTPRNALRLNVLPEIEKSYPSAAAALSRFGRLSRIESELIARMSAALLKERLQTGSYGRRLLLNGDEEEAVLRRALREIAGRALTADKVDALTSLARKKRGKLEISDELLAEKTPSALYFLPKAVVHPPETPLHIPGETELFGLCRILAEEGNFVPDPDDPNSEVFDADQLSGATLRTRRNGDRIRPLGASGDKLFSDYLTDRKLDRPLRDYLPLIARGNRILWACGLGMAHDARIQNVTQRTVRLKIYFITDEEPEVLL